MTTPQSAAAPAGTVGAVVRPVILQDCDCDGFRKGNGIWFDSQDLREFNYKSCPACHKPFKTWPSEAAYLADQQPNTAVCGPKPSAGLGTQDGLVGDSSSEGI